MCFQVSGFALGSEDGGGVQNWAFLTFERQPNTSKGVMSPVTVTFFEAKSMLKDVTPMCCQNHYNELN